jgi:SAM-dependent methyltransferase
MKPALKRPNQALRTSGESWRPVSCTNVTPLWRFFDFQSGTIWRDLSSFLRQVRGTLVDVGCGAQPYRQLLAKGVNYIGIDSEEARTVFGYNTSDTRYYDGFSWPVEDGLADIVLATETLEHVSDPEQFLREARRVLRTGGTLAMTIPFAARWHYVPVDYWRFTPAGLTRLLGKSEFTEIEIYARGNALTVACYKCLALLAVLVLPQGRSPVGALLMRIAGLVLSPFVVVLAVIGNLSLGLGSGDDCLGYTVFAKKS